MADGPAPGPSRTVEARAAYDTAGYDLADAEQLAQLWREDDLGLVKVLAGQQLLDGVAPPVP